VTRTVRLYHRRIAELKAVLLRLKGPCKCGENRPERLTIHHEDGRDYDVALLSSHTRAERYRRELEAGIRLALLCLACNGFDGYLQRGRLTPARKRRRKGRR